MASTHHTFCRICESLCGLEVDVDGERVTAIRPDAKHVTTGGFACVKGLKQHTLFDSPDRLLHPQQRRDDGALERVSWDAALTGIGSKVQQLRRDHGPDSIGVYVGTAAGFSMLHPIFAQGFMTGLGTRSAYATATQDCANKFAAARDIYGFPFSQPFPDVDRTQCLIVVGANPVVSKWSFLQVPNPVERLRAIEARGGKLYWVDPRRTESAKVAGEYVGIRPGTDVFFYLAFLNELIATAGVDHERVARFMENFGPLARLAEQWTPERTAPVTRIPAATLRTMVRDYREADGAALYSSTGVNMGGHGTLAFWIQEAINAISGNLDRSGGTLVGEGIVDFAKLGARGGVGLRDDRSRIGDFRSVNDQFPGGVMADEILTEGPGQLKALFVTGGNPLLTMPNSERLRAAFEKLELLVTIDILPNETGALAHYLLPATSPLERIDLPFLFPLLMGMQSRPYLQATERVVKAQGEQRDEATIFLDLARACDAPLFGSKLVQRGLEAGRAWHTRRRRRADPADQPSLPQRALLSGLLRVTGNGSFARLLAEEHGRPRPEHAPGSFLGKRVVRPGGRVDLAPPALVAQAEKLDVAFERERADQAQLRLISRRHVKTHNSWTHNEREFVKGRRRTNYLYMNPDDARAAGLATGDLADVRSATGAVRLPIELLDDLQPGTCALPHGWGHQGAEKLGVASATEGVNVNLLAADGPEALERQSGMARLTAIPVTVEAARGPRNPHHWSGLPAAENPAAAASTHASANASTAS